MKVFSAVSLLLYATITSSVLGQPTIITRSAWGAREPSQPGTIFSEIPPLVIVSHSALPSCTTEDECKDRVKSIQNLHMNENNWEDIGYNFLIGEDGNVYEGRGWSVIGAHSRGYNVRSIGICVMGNFENREPNSAAIEAIKELLEYGATMGKISPAYTLYGHRQTSLTASPGTKMYELIKTWPHWQARN